MDFSYQGNGSIKTGGCSAYDLSQNHPVKFSHGSIVYNCWQATHKGVLEKLAIKSYRIVFGHDNVLYKDTFNRLWNEDDLCYQQEAIALAIAYYENVALLSQQANCH